MPSVNIYLDDELDNKIRLEMDKAGITSKVGMVIKLLKEGLNKQNNTLDKVKEKIVKPENKITIAAEEEAKSIELDSDDFTLDDFDLEDGN